MLKKKLRRVNNTGFVIEADFNNSFEIKPDMAIMYKNQEIGL